MFYRRKVIFSLMELLNGEVEKLRLQKLLFLYAMRRENPEYDFVPYKYGSYSFSASADLNTMAKKGQIKETPEAYQKLDVAPYLPQLKATDRVMLEAVVADYGSMSTRALIRHTYLNFPFYAINSTMARDILPGNQYDRVEQAKPADNAISLFTLGYEGISLERYLQKLIRHNVKLLVDVRKNPKSMKFGFSKSLLERYCAPLGIAYLHIPEVGIAAEKRQQLVTQADYDRLFADYWVTTLSRTGEAQERILALLRQYKRIALTCFEAQPCQCHRSHLAKALEKSPNFHYPLNHL